MTIEPFWTQISEPTLRRGRPATAPRWRLMSPFLEHFSQALFSDQSRYDRGLVEGNPVG
jgi:hypothetical protein